MWRSKIRNCPDPDFALYRRGTPTAEYEAWVDRIMQEPWFAALLQLVEHTGQWWVGTGQELIEQLKRRVGEEVSNSADFPSTLDHLKDYAWIAGEAFTRADIDILDYHLAKTYGTEEFDAPGWGPEAPILIFQSNSVLRPDYVWTLGKVLERWDPFLLALFLFTSGERLGNGRWWEGTTHEFVEAVRRQRPDQESVPDYISRCFRPTVAGPLPEYEDDEEYTRLMRPRSNEDYEAFFERMRKNSPFLEEIGIRVRLECHPCEIRIPEDDVGQQRDWERVRWVVRAPRWLRTWHL